MDRYEGEHVVLAGCASNAVKVEGAAPFESPHAPREDSLQLSANRRLTIHCVTADLNINSSRDDGSTESSRARNLEICAQALISLLLEQLNEPEQAEGQRFRLTGRAASPKPARVLGAPDPKKKAKELEVKLGQRLRKHMGNPNYKALSERLEKLKERHEAGQLHSIAFLKELLDIARDVVAAEKETPPEEDEDRGKAALTELFQEVKNDSTPVVVQRIVNDIDEIVRLIRFPGWQQTSAGEREVKKALRKTLFKYKLHADAELFEKAYGYIKQYY